MLDLTMHFGSRSHLIFSHRSMGAAAEGFHCSLPLSTFGHHMTKLVISKAILPDSQFTASDLQHRKSLLR